MQVEPPSVTSRRVTNRGARVSRKLEGGPAPSRPATTTHVVALLLAILTAVAALMACCLAGCGESQSEQPGASVPVLSVGEALEAAEGTTAQVQGILVATSERVVLASALLESFPPQAGGKVLSLEGLKIETLVGLSSTEGLEGVEPVTWSDYPVVLTGTLRNGTLLISSGPAVIENYAQAGDAGKVRVRFTVAPEPLAAGSSVWWVFDVTNLTSSPIDVVFSSGQRGDVVLRAGGKETYRWSSGKFFTEAVEVVSLNPGDALPIVLNDILAVPASEYDLEAEVNATVAINQTSNLVLPKVKTKLMVWQ
ncbi:MAG: BsuPI-related putative proteinase inhibitor [Thermoleophilia bacterium]|nr:BsuPI-related putative proteinase inhibitor [Thermoleophilia bacterium]